MFYMLMLLLFSSTKKHFWKVSRADLVGGSFPVITRSDSFFSNFYFFCVKSDLFGLIEPFLIYGYRGEIKNRILLIKRSRVDF